LEARERVDGQTVFHMVCERGWTELVAPLLDAGADTAALDSHGRTGLELAAAAHQLALVQALRDAVEQGEPKDNVAALADQFRLRESTLAGFTNHSGWLDPTVYSAGHSVQPEHAGWDERHWPQWVRKAAAAAEGDA
jgi:ankyrin repeat protein